MRKKYLVILSLFIAMILCFTAPAVALADSVVVNPGSGGNVTVIVPTDPGDGTSTIVTVTEDEPVIGDIVSFAGHEWYVIGTDSEGVIAPEGCYTLFAKNNEFGSTAFRSGMSNKDISIVYYKDSDLKKAMENIANGFSSADIANIVPRATLDGIWGDAVTDQLLWPIGWAEEGVNIATSIREFGSAYWTRNGFQDKPTDGFIVKDPDTGEVKYTTNPPDYSVPIIEANGDIQESYNLGTLCTAEYPGNTHAVRPAAYVKTDAVSKTESKEYKAVVGSQIQFAGYNWYIVGMGDTGPVPGPANTVTLFAASSIKDETGECINSYTDTNYADGELSTVMEGLSDTLGLSAREKALITDRTLTTADGISGNSVTTPFWPLSIDEYEAIYEYDPSFLTDTPGWYYWLRTEYGAYSCIYSVNTKTGSISTTYSNTNSFWVRPACYLDLSDLFFASGESGMRASVGEYPSKLEGPLYGSLQNYNFVMHDDTLSLSMVGAATQRNGSSLTFHYDAVQGEQHYLSYLVERASAPGIPVYYGRAVNLSNSGSGTVTVPLTDDGNMRTGIPLVNGDYILRFYTEDRSQGDIIFAGNTVAVGVYVNENKVAISDIKDVNQAAFITGVTITPSSASVENGEQYQFSATVSTDGDEWYDPSVTWSVNGENSYGTYISDTGLLTVGIDETSPTITVTATSVQDSSKRASVTVSIVYVEPKVAILFRDSTTLYKDVESAVAAISGFETTEENRARIILLDNIDLTSTLTFNTGFITLDLNGNMLKQTGSGSVISIGEGADVVLDDWVGATTTHNYYVAEDGLWVFYDGELPAEAAGAETGTVTGGVITGGTADFDGGGVYVSSGTFTMEGGTISGNTAANYGGGVAVYGKFTMTGGTISGNTATYGGGVNVEGTFTLEDGMITDNTANSGGGVGVVRYATFTMTGGTITGNTGEYGGGVYVVSSTFTLSGGTISGNTASLDGGGVYTDVSTFTMKDGAITNNIASNNYNERGGGGVFVGGTFTMEGGTISGNTAPNGCGGGVNVYNSSDSMFNMTGGYLGDNTASESGNNIFKAGDGNVSISGGYFSEPPAEANIAENCDLYELTALGGAAFDSDYKDGFPYAVYAQGVISISTKNIVYDGSPVAEGVDFTVTGADGMTLGYRYKQEGGEYVSGLPTDAGEYTILACALDYAQKTYYETTFELNIQKAAPSYTKLTDIKACVEQTLADIKLPEGWEWQDPSLGVGNETGEKQFKAIFTPEDTSNYNTAEESVTVTVTAHTGGTATCTDKAVCSVCGMKYGELAEHTAVEIPAVEATCTQSGMTAGSKCSVCGEILVAPEEIAPLGHVDENGDELCDRCGFDMSIPEFTITVTGGTIEGAIGSTVIVEENGSVTVVASEAPEGKEFRGWSIDGGETIVSEEAAYTFTASEDTVLTAVFADKQSDVKPGGEITPENPEGLSGGAIAGITIGTLAFAGLGGFAIFWFAVRKKSFADLGVALKKGFTAIGNFFKNLGAKIKALFTKKK